MSIASLLINSTKYKTSGLVTIQKFIFSSDLCRGAYWFLTYAGYAGDLSPQLTMELLTGKENSVLIDVRPEARNCNFF